MFRQLMFVFHHRVRAFGSPVTPGAVHDCCFSVADMVIGCNNESGVHKSHNHVKVAAGVFTEAMDKLDDAFGLACWDIDPPLDHIPFVE